MKLLTLITLLTFSSLSQATLIYDTASLINGEKPEFTECFVKLLTPGARMGTACEIAAFSTTVSLPTMLIADENDQDMSEEAIQENLVAEAFGDKKDTHTTKQVAAHLELSIEEVKVATVFLYDNDLDITLKNIQDITTK